MSLNQILLMTLVAAISLAYGVFVGRAQAQRVRNLTADVSRGKISGLLTIALVFFMILATFVL